MRIDRCTIYPALRNIADLMICLWSDALPHTFAMALIMYKLSAVGDPMGFLHLHAATGANRKGRRSRSTIRLMALTLREKWCTMTTKHVSPSLDQHLRHVNAGTMGNDLHEQYREMIDILLGKWC